MFDVSTNPTELQYKYYFLSVSQTESEDGLPSAQLLQLFKPNLEELVQDISSGRMARPGSKRKVGYSMEYTNINVTALCCIWKGFLNACYWYYCEPIIHT